MIDWVLNTSLRTLVFMYFLIVNHTKWLNTLKQFFGNSRRRIVCVCLTILWVKPFQTNAPFLYPLITWEKRRFSVVFRGCKGNGKGNISSERVCCVWKWTLSWLVLTIYIWLFFVVWCSLNYFEVRLQIFVFFGESWKLSETKSTTIIPWP